MPLLPKFVQLFQNLLSWNLSPPFKTGGLPKTFIWYKICRVVTILPKRLVTWNKGLKTGFTVTWQQVKTNDINFCHAWETRWSQPNVETKEKLRSYPVEGSGIVFSRKRRMGSRFLAYMSHCSTFWRNRRMSCDVKIYPTTRYWRRGVNVFF